MNYPAAGHEHDPIAGEEEIELNSEDRAVGCVETEGRASPGGAHQWADQQQTTECCTGKPSHHNPRFLLTWSPSHHHEVRNGAGEQRA